MQDAFAQEKLRVGTWPEIGYTAPGTASTGKSTYTSKVFKYSGAADSAWTAQPTGQALNDCKADNASYKWSLTARTSTNKDVTIADASTHADCKVLTASWDNLIKTGN